MGITTYHRRAAELLLVLAGILTGNGIIAIPRRRPVPQTPAAEPGNQAG